MPDLNTFLREMQRDDNGPFEEIARDVTTQFGGGNRVYKGAQLLPERSVNERHTVKEERVLFRPGSIANAGDRHSPAQLKDSGQFITSWTIEMLDSDIAAQMTSVEYEALISLLDRNASQDAIAQIVQFGDTRIVNGLIELNEKLRWEMILTNTAEAIGDNGFSKTVEGPDRDPQNTVSIVTPWSDDTYNPLDDIYGMSAHMTDKGFPVAGGRIITSDHNVRLLLNNDKVRTRVFGGSSVERGNTLFLGRATLAEMNSFLALDGIPPIETYDLKYRTQTSAHRFMAQDVMVFVAPTGQQEVIDPGDDPIIVPDTVGYTAIGIPVSQQTPGRKVRSEFIERKPQHLYFEGWQTTVPVLNQPDAIGVISGIN
jgi:hypothetical protein